MKKLIFSFFFFILFVIFCFTGTSSYKENKKIKIVNGSILSQNKKELTIQDKKNIIYILKDKVNANVGDLIAIKYTGVLNNKNIINKENIVNYEITPVIQEKEMRENFQDYGIFSDFYALAEEKLKTMSLDEKINQILLVRYPDDGLTILKEYPFGGYIFFEKDFKDKTKEQIQGMISSLQASVKIPILTAVDEEGGSVVRISSNKNLRKEKFKSPSELYKEGGFSNIELDTIEKSALLNELGLNVNLAPVVDVSTEKDNYIYDRALGEDTEKTSEYAKTVIKASKNMKVSYVLKHFPGYGNNDDTHEGKVEDTRPFETIKKTDLPPFEAGIKEGAEAVLVNHNIVKSVDDKNPASLSSSVHNLLRDDLGFTGIIITDDIAMNSLKNIENKTVKAIQAGNDLIITTNYEESRKEIKDAINNNTISENTLDKMVFRILAWKYYKGLLFETIK